MTQNTIAIQKVAAQTSVDTAANAATFQPVASTKDAGRVHVGAGALRFGNAKDAGRVRFGAGALRF